MAKLEWHDFGLKKASKNSIVPPTLNTDPANLIPTLEAIDKQMLEAEEQNQFEIIKLKADSPNCTFST